METQFLIVVIATLVASILGAPTTLEDTIDQQQKSEIDLTASSESQNNNREKKAACIISRFATTDPLQNIQGFDQELDFPERKAIYNAGYRDFPVSYKSKPFTHAAYSGYGMHGHGQHFHHHGFSGHKGHGYKKIIITKHRESDGEPTELEASSSTTSINNDQTKDNIEIKPLAGDREAAESIHIDQTIQSPKEATSNLKIGESQSERQKWKKVEKAGVLVPQEVEHSSRSANSADVGKQQSWKDSQSAKFVFDTIDAMKHSIEAKTGSLKTFEPAKIFNVFSHNTQSAKLASENVSGMAPAHIVAEDEPTNWGSAHTAKQASEAGNGMTQSFKSAHISADKKHTNWGSVNSANQAFETVNGMAQSFQNDHVAAKNERTNWGSAHTTKQVSEDINKMAASFNSAHVAAENDRTNWGSTHGAKETSQHGNAMAQTFKSTHVPTETKRTNWGSAHSAKQASEEVTATAQSFKSAYVPVENERTNWGSAHTAKQVSEDVNKMAPFKSAHVFAENERTNWGSTHGAKQASPKVNVMTQSFKSAHGPTEAKHTNWGTAHSAKKTSEDVNTKVQPFQSAQVSSGNERTNWGSDVMHVEGDKNKVHSAARASISVDKNEHAVEITGIIKQSANQEGSSEKYSKQISSFPKQAREDVDVSKHFHKLPDKNQKAVSHTQVQAAGSDRNAQWVMQDIGTKNNAWQASARSYGEYDSAALAGSTVAAISLPRPYSPYGVGTLPNVRPLVNLEDGSHTFSDAALYRPTVGLFPNARIGGCAIPILLSCSPSVISGQLLQQHQSYNAGYASPDAYGQGLYRASGQDAELKQKG